MPPQQGPEDETDDLVYTTGGTITAAEAAVREAAGTLDASDLADQGALLDEATAAAAEERLGALGQLQAGVEGAAAGLTFDASRLLDADDDIAAAEQLERRQVFAKTALAGEVGGALLGTFASAGQGLPGTIARLTPRGMLEAAAVRSISQGASMGARAVRGIGFGAVEGGLDVAGNYIARAALDEDVDFSGAELGRSMLSGALLGGVAGGVGGALTPGALPEGTVLTSTGRAIVPEEHLAEVRKLLGEATPQTVRREVGRGRVWKKTDPADLAEIASESMIRRSRGSYHQLQERVADAARRTGADEVEDVLGSPILRTALGEQEHATLGAKLRGLAAERDEAALAAKRWADAHSAIVGRTKNARELAAKLREVPADLEDAAGPVLARFDEATSAFDAEIAKVRSARAVIDDLPPEGRAAAALSPGVATRVRGFLENAAASVKSIPGVSATVEAAEKVATAAEVAQSLGGNVPSLSSILGHDNPLGQAVGLYLKARVAGRVLGKAGDKLGISSTPVTRAARAVNAGRARVSGAIDAGIAAATGRLRRSAAPLLVTGAVKTLAAVDGEALREQAARDALDLPSDIAAAAIAQVERVAGYLDRVRPRDPNAGTPWAGAWRPGAVAESEYATRARAALDPEWAIARAFDTPGASLEIEALRECHPDVFARAQRQLVTVASDRALRDAMPESLRQSLGRGFGVPLSITQLPGYGAVMAQAPAPKADPNFGAPSAVASNPIVSTEELRGPGRRRN